MSRSKNHGKFISDALEEEEDNSDSKDNDIDLSLFPCGPSWIGFLLRERQENNEEKKLAELYEQGFAIMMSEHGLL